LFYRTRLPSCLPVRSIGLPTNTTE